MVNTEWLRLLSVFMVVMATRRLFWPRRRASKASSVLFTSTSVTLETYMLWCVSSLRDFDLGGLGDRERERETVHLIQITQLTFLT